MKGRMGGSMGGYVERAPRCKHSWSKWERAAVFDPRVKRTCGKCGWLQLRKAPKPKANRPARQVPQRTPVAMGSETMDELKTRVRASIKEAKKARR